MMRIPDESTKLDDIVDSAKVAIIDILVLLFILGCLASIVVCGIALAKAA